MEVFQSFRYCPYIDCWRLDCGFDVLLPAAVAGVVVAAARLFDLEECCMPGII